VKTSELKPNTGLMPGSVLAAEVSMRSRRADHGTKIHAQLLRDAFEPRRDIHAVPQYVVAVDPHVTQVDADAEQMAHPTRSRPRKLVISCRRLDPAECLLFRCLPVRCGHSQIRVDFAFICTVPLRAQTRSVDARPTSSIFAELTPGATGRPSRKPARDLSRIDRVEMPKNSERRFDLR
jgi:hypothetical protein